MRIHFTRIGCCLLLLCAIASCDLAEVGDAIIVSDVEDEFYIDMWEDLSGENGARELVLKIESIEPANCLNYDIDYQSARLGNRLSVSLNQFIEPADCLAGEAPVKADINLGSLPSGNYNVNIDFRNTVENDGQLLVSPESYFLTMKSEDGIVLLREELLRVPEDVIWGYVALRAGADAAVAEAFLADLQAISDEPKALRSGYYGHFTINNLNGEVFIYEQPTDGSAINFLRQYTDASAALKTLVADYRDRHGEELIIRMFNADGEAW